MSKYKYIAEIPARLGSQRVKQKNLRLIEGEPMIAYAIKACKNASSISEVYVNTESDLIGQVALDYGVKYYKRREELALNHVVSDQFNYDFLKKIECEALVMVNPVSPLVESVDIEEAINFFEINQLDSMISVKDEKLQCFYQERALNFNKDGLLPMTQNIDPVRVCVWTICIWRRESFIKSYEKNGYAVFNGKCALWSIDPLKSIKISYEEDFLLAEQLLRARKYYKKSEIRYYGE
ncbi:acylneuraminate cytidylyltransferase [Campylobacter jejuni]|uniref:Acylneuraminate cytidylyltransferase n=2 Tax=Campylobacter jejuni TaxID=197 RepID=A0A5T1V7F0_CAMJU|nr:acylneuraminate cytidylyltransferase [Campylobacter jejuni]EAL9390994.1 acylneuraminate cytidylyltransferase [Campylobacter coli]AJK71589.1 acylneuraminate cytidylyltransferase [Campylobacter jejuni subsp. jejuni]ALT31885.1 N-acetylneuraminate cytidylyltransferase [Campylobacter jejuni subsp. jejuni]EAH4617263.1 acylneuraminate cytidylyltransferase [Campylobacter jejuni]EAH6389134.1 acylneuraminate cytidylyltransferase [Campylobacter jejuni]